MHTASTTTVNLLEHWRVLLHDSFNNNTVALRHTHLPVIVPYLSRVCVVNAARCRKEGPYTTPVSCIPLSNISVVCKELRHPPEYLAGVRGKHISTWVLVCFGSTTTSMIALHYSSTPLSAPCLSGACAANVPRCRI